VKLVPRALETMPEVSDGGSTYTFRFRKGIFFTPDPAFGGKPRSSSPPIRPTRSGASSIPR
jgi:hypothetical protein